MNTQFERNLPNYKEEWLTPPSIIKSLGDFDLDPCSPINRPWDTAKKHFNVNDDGLAQNWGGQRVWCNPPYGSKTHLWLEKCAQNGNAIALVFARTETKMFFDYVWNAAHAVCFIERRIQFLTIDGKKKGSAGAPSVLIAYGQNNIKPLHESKLGKVVLLKSDC